MSDARQPPPGFGLVGILDDKTWHTGALITGVVQVTNAATERRLVFYTGSPAIGALFTSDGIPVGNNSRPHRGAGRAVDLAPGATTTLRFICGSSSLDTKRGTTLPSGDYNLVVHLRATTDDRQDLFATPPIPIRLLSP